MSEPKDVPIYNPTAATLIGKDMGLEPDDPNNSRIAASEMEGANETASGGLHARQTACNVLKYNEALPESKGQKEGKTKTEKDLNKFLKQQRLRSVEEWMRQASRKRK